MTLFKVCGAAAIFIIFSVCFFKEKNSRAAFFTGLGMCLFLLVSSLEELIPVIKYIKDLGLTYENSGKYTEILLKTTGVGFICSALSGICRENGEISVAACIEFFGKSEIIILILPLFHELLTLAFEGLG